MEMIMTVEDAYKEYLASNDKTVIIDGEEYYKVVFIAHFNDSRLGNFVHIVLHSDMFQPEVKFNKIKDEKDNIYKLSGPEMIHFDDAIPEWYFKCWSFFIIDSESDSLTQDIGNYSKTCI